MKLTERVNADIATAMKAKDTLRLSTLRMLKTALTNKSIEKGHDLDDAEAHQVIGTLIKQRRDSIEQFGKGGRQDLVDRETAEIGVLEGYLPPPVSDEELAAAIEAAVKDTGASSPKDMGRVMKAVMAQLAGRAADGRVVSELVKKRLS